jgi:hypothetical protein
MGCMCIAQYFRVLETCFVVPLLFYEMLVLLNIICTMTIRKVGEICLLVGKSEFLYGNMHLHHNSLVLNLYSTVLRSGMGFKFIY